MDFDLTHEQRILADTIIRFGKQELAGDVIARDEAGEFWREGWRRCAGIGIQGLPVPEVYGGAGADPLTIVVGLEALGYACRDNGLIFSLNAHMWACEIPIVKFGTQEQKRRYLPGLCDGSLIGAHAMTEPGSGSDPFSLATTAERKGALWLLNGQKTFVSNAPEANVFVVFATTDRTLGFAGLCAFLVERDAPGLSVGRPLHKMGLRTSPMAEVFLEGCEVPEENLLGKAGGGMAVFNSAMEQERGFILACTVGTMRRQLERCIAHAQERKQFNQPIGKFQAVSHRIVDMKVRLETARLALYHLGWMMSQGRQARLETALTKLYLSECFVASSLDALQIHGGYGYMTEYELERDLRDAVGSRLYSGTSEMQRNIVAHQLRL
ncbi:MAG: acyl-CoA dehydrogenase family protein [Actinomycetota bacterium]